MEFHKGKRGKGLKEVGFQQSLAVGIGLCNLWTSQKMSLIQKGGDIHTKSTGQKSGSDRKPKEGKGSQYRLEGKPEESGTKKWCQMTERGGIGIYTGDSKGTLPNEGKRLDQDGGTEEDEIKQGIGVVQYTYPDRETRPLSYNRPEKGSGYETSAINQHTGYLLKIKGGKKGRGEQTETM